MKNKLALFFLSLGLFVANIPGVRAVELHNPLGAGTTFRSLLGKIFTGVSQILLIVVPIIIVVGAFQMLFASGEPEKFKKGQKTIVYAVIGLVVVLLAQGIVAIVEEIFSVGV